MKTLVKREYEVAYFSNAFFRSTIKRMRAEIMKWERESSATESDLVDILIARVGDYQQALVAENESKFAERMAQEAKDARDNLAALVQGYPTFPEVQAERDKLAQEVERLRKALQDVWGIITQFEMQCHFPSNDGTDDCGDIDLCLFHALAKTLDAALAATGEPLHRCVLCGSPAEFSEADGVWRHSGKPFQKGFEAQQFCGKYGYPIEVRAALANKPPPILAGAFDHKPGCRYPDYGECTCGVGE